MFIRLIRSYLVLHFFVCGMIVKLINGINDKLLPSENHLIMSPIFDNYKEHDFVVHVDEPNLNFLGLMGQRDPTNLITFFKYTDEEYIFRRPLAQKCVHFVLQENEEKYFLQHYAHVEGNIDETDVIMLLASKFINTERNFTSYYNTGVDRANIVFYLNRTLCYAIYFYNSPDMQPRIFEVDRKSRFEPKLNEYSNRFRNFRGFPLKFGYTRCEPFIYIDNTWGYLAGVEFKILEIVRHLLNFSTDFYDYTPQIDGRLKLIQDVNKSILHCAFGCLSNNVKRNEMVSFSTMLQAEPHIVIYSSLGRYESPPIYLIIEPLQEIVWVCVVCMMIVVMLFVKLLIVIENDHVDVDPILLPISILLEHSFAIPSKSNALRFSLVTWLLMGFALSSSYKSKLTATLIMPPTKEPVVLSQLVSEGYHFISPAKDSTYIMELLRLSDDPDIKHVGKEIEDTKSVCEAIITASTHVSAVIEEQTVLRYKVWNRCFKNLTLQQMRSLRRLASPITVNGHVWAMPKAAPYKKRISQVLEYLKSVGLVQKWYRAYNISRTIAISNTVQSRGDAQPLEPLDLVSAYIVLAIGCFLGLILFALESMIHNGQSYNIPLKHFQATEYYP